METSDDVYRCNAHPEAEAITATTDLGDCPDELLLAALESSGAAERCDANCSESSDDDTQTADTALEFPLSAMDSLPTAVSLDRENARSWVFPSAMHVRAYQFAIVRRALTRNTLVCLPTGLGKTLIAAVVMLNYMRWYPDGVIVFVAPTRPLVHQQMNACYQTAGIPPPLTVELTGHTRLSVRRELWRTRRVFFLTPQVMMNDVLRHACPVDRIVCVVFDEAHRATGRYAYCGVVPEIERATQGRFRVLALTATPGSNTTGIQQVLHNLRIAHIEFRHECDPDVLPYTHERQVHVERVPLNAAIAGVLHAFQLALAGSLQKLCAHGAFYQRNPEKVQHYQLVVAQRRWMEACRQQTAAYTDSNGAQGTRLSLFRDFGHALVLCRGAELLRAHGLEACLRYLEQEMHAQAKSNPRSNAELTRRDAVRALHQRVKQLVEHGSRHPKIERCRELVVQHFLQHGSNSTRVMIFVQYRDVVTELEAALAQAAPTVRPASFIGQANGGMTQPEQHRIMRLFRQGAHNCLVSTSIGEEGLDIGHVDLIISFDALGSPIRMLQRMGRTGRARAGQVIILVSESNEAQRFEDMNRRANSIMSTLRDKYNKFTFFKRSPLMLPATGNPIPCELVSITVHPSALGSQDHPCSEPEQALGSSEHPRLLRLKHAISYGNDRWAWPRQRPLLALQLKKRTQLPVTYAEDLMRGVEAQYRARCSSQITMLWITVHRLVQQFLTESLERQRAPKTSAIAAVDAPVTGASIEPQQRLYDQLRDQENDGCPGPTIHRLSAAVSGTERSPLGSLTAIANTQQPAEVIETVCKTQPCTWAGIEDSKQATQLVDDPENHLLFGAGGAHRVASALPEIDLSQHQFAETPCSSAWDICFPKATSHAPEDAGDLSLPWESPSRALSSGQSTTSLVHIPTPPGQNSSITHLESENCSIHLGWESSDPICCPPRSPETGGSRQHQATSLLMARCHASDDLEHKVSFSTATSVFRDNDWTESLPEQGLSFTRSMRTPQIPVRHPIINADPARPGEASPQRLDIETDPSPTCEVGFDEALYLAAASLEHARASAPPDLPMVTRAEKQQLQPLHHVLDEQLDIRDQTSSKTEAAAISTPQSGIASQSGSHRSPGLDLETVTSHQTERCVPILRQRGRLRRLLSSSPEPSVGKHACSPTVAAAATEISPVEIESRLPQVSAGTPRAGRKTRRISLTDPLTNGSVTDPTPGTASRCMAVASVERTRSITKRQRSSRGRQPRRCRALAAAFIDDEAEASSQRTNAGPDLDCTSIPWSATADSDEQHTDTPGSLRQFLTSQATSPSTAELRRQRAMYWRSLRSPVASFFDMASESSDIASSVAAHENEEAEPESSCQTATTGPSAATADSSCYRCRRNQDPQNTLLCDGCDMECHTYCCDPPLASVPSGPWYCPRCEAYRSNLRLLAYSRTMTNAVTSLVREQLAAQNPSSVVIPCPSLEADYVVSSRVAIFYLSDHDASDKTRWAQRLERAVTLYARVFVCWASVSRSTVFPRGFPFPFSSAIILLHCVGVAQAAQRVIQIAVAEHEYGYGLAWVPLSWPDPLAIAIQFLQQAVGLSWPNAMFALLEHGTIQAVLQQWSDTNDDDNLSPAPKL
jgi:ERCC4-related helicase